MKCVDVRRVMGSLMNLASIPYYQICVDESSTENISGRMYCGIYPEGFDFSGVEALIFKMENIMDQIKFPEAAMEKRSFSNRKNNQNPPLKVALESQKQMRKFNPDLKMGVKATFIVQIQFRQKASWQGLVKWLEGNNTYKFESELEFLKILDAVTRKNINEI